MKSRGVEIRPWQAPDRERLMAAQAGLSAQTLRLRFWSAVPALPDSYLRRVGERWPRCWDAVVAVDGDRLVGWAEYGRAFDDPTHADVAVCVIDAAQGHGLGTALLGAVVERARAAGLVSVHVDIEPANRRARLAWITVTGGPSHTYALAG
jgi:GNAT superfamily N-acetyltransferase